MNKTVYIFVLLFPFASCSQNDAKNIDIEITKAFSAYDPLRKSVADSLKYLLPILDSVLENDQRFRKIPYTYKGDLDNTAALKRFSENKDVAKKIDIKNQEIVCNILDRYGWLGFKDIGMSGNLAIFMVIQHSDISVQEKYLPLLRKAVSEKRDIPHHLALLEDKICVKKNNYQIYGTQLKFNSRKKIFELQPILNPENLLNRRLSIGLDSASLNQYLKGWNLEWNFTTNKEENIK
jgi:hypothetical protein